MGHISVTGLESFGTLDWMNVYMKKRRLSIRWNNEIHIGRGILRITLIILCLMAGAALARELYHDMELREQAEESGFMQTIQDTVMNVWMPGLNAWRGETEHSGYNPLERLVLENFPVFLYSTQQKEKYQAQALQESSYEELLLLEGSDEDRKGIDEDSLEYGEDAIHLDKSLEEAFLAENGLISENQAAGGKNKETQENNIAEREETETVFHEVEEPAYRYQWDELRNYEDRKSVV